MEHAMESLISGAPAIALAAGALALSQGVRHLCREYVKRRICHDD